VGVLDLGEHRLRDLGRPERITQLLHRDLTADFPPLRSLDAYPGNLPVQRTGFVGRNEELTELAAALTDSSVVTLIGFGGVGKTRLALQVAADAVARFPEGVWFVDLGPVVDASFVPAAVATALQLPERRHGTIDDGIVAALRRKRALLVVDNCEHVVEGAARLVDVVVSSCPGVTVMATSREALGIEGEEAFVVAPLPLPAAGGDGPGALLASDAVRLFVERARGVRRHFALSTDNAPVVAELCRRLDGIPLAIELAAARVQSMSPADVLGRLTERFQILTRGRRTLERHQTLRAAIDWSYELLEPAEQLVLARLSVFAGGFTLDAAEAVVSGESVEIADVLDLLAALVAKSMLVADASGGAVRYQLLETMREYARDRLEQASDGEAERVRGRHLAYYQELAVTASAHLEGADDQEWIERLDADDDNFRVALARARDSGDADGLLTVSSALSRYWLHNGNRRDGLVWLETALAMAPDAPAAIRAEVMTWAGSHANDLGRYEDGRALLEGSLRCSAEAGQPPMPLTLQMLGILELEAHRPDLAVQRCEEALAAAVERGSAFDEVDSLTGLSLVCALGADETRAVPLAEEGLGKARRLGNRYGLSMALQSAGHAHLRTDPSRAVAQFEEAEFIARRSGTSVIGNLLFFKGIARLRLGELALAARDIGEALLQFEQGGNHYYLSMALGLAATVATRHDPSAAVRLLAAADRVRDDLGLGGAPQDVEAQRRTRDRLASTLAPDEFTAAWDQGRALDLEDAVALAHRVLDELATGT
jgi:predicted ATPase